VYYRTTAQVLDVVVPHRKTESITAKLVKKAAKCAVKYLAKHNDAMSGSALQNVLYAESQEVESKHQAKLANSTSWYSSYTASDNYQQLFTIYYVTFTTDDNTAHMAAVLLPGPSTAAGALAGKLRTVATYTPKAWAAKACQKGTENDAKEKKHAYQKTTTAAPKKKKKKRIRATAAPVSAGDDDDDDDKSATAAPKGAAAAAKAAAKAAKAKAKAKAAAPATAAPKGAAAKGAAAMAKAAAKAAKAKAATKPVKPPAAPLANYAGVADSVYSSNADDDRLVPTGTAAAAAVATDDDDDGITTASIVKHIKVTGSKLRDHATGQSGSPVGSALTWLLILGLLFCASKLGGSRKSANGGVIGEVAWYAGRASIKLKRMVGGDEVRAPACCLASSGARTEMCVHASPTVVLVLVSL
jgi:hypothetical protein